MRAEDLLPNDQSEIERNGLTIRKGSVGAFLANAGVWGNPASDTEKRQAAERDMVDALPALRAIGLFDVFVARDAALRRLIETH